MQCNRRTLILTGAALLASRAPVRAQTPLAAVGFAETATGEAWAEFGGVRRRLDARSAVFDGDLTATGAAARLLLRLGPATSIALGADTRLRIDRYHAERGGVLDLLAGHIQFERRGKLASEGILLRCPHGLIAVRGTRFIAGPSRGRFAVLVGEGRVEVTAGGRAVMVGPQQAIEIPAPGQPPSAPAVWEIARIREMQASVR